MVRIFKTLVILVTLIIGSSNVMAGDKELPLLLDLSKLKLKISSFETVDSVCELGNGCISAKGEEQSLVVVTLTGFLPKPSMVSLQSDDFAATPAQGTIWRTSNRSVAVSVNDTRVVQKREPGTGGIFAVPLKKAGPITIKVAFILRKNLNEFLVSYPAFAGGRIVLSGERKEGQ